MTEFGDAHASFKVVKITVLSSVAASIKTLSSPYSSTSYNHSRKRQKSKANKSTTISIKDKSNPNQFNTQA